jgi:hypothetical protein
MSPSYEGGIFNLNTMLKLFKYNKDTYEIDVSPEAMMLSVFKRLKTKYKSDDKFKQVLDFIYFYSDPRSDYAYITDDETRAEEIKKALGLPDKWSYEEKEVQEAIDYYSSMKPISAQLLEDTFKTVNKLRAYMNDIDFKQLDDKGKPVYPPNMITSTIKMIPSLVKDLHEAERAVTAEIADAIRARGNAEGSIFDNGINI